MQIQPLALSTIFAPTAGPATAAGASGSSSFEGVLGQTLQGLSNVQGTADKQAIGLATGKDVSLVDTVMSMEQTSLNFKMVMQVRDKVVEAYQEVMRTQV